MVKNLNKLTSSCKLILIPWLSFSALFSHCLILLGPVHFIINNLLYNLKLQHKHDNVLNVQTYVYTNAHTFILIN